MAFPDEFFQIFGFKRVDNTMTKIYIEIKNCSECPYILVKRTPDTGFGEDYFCTLTDDIKQVMGYIEWNCEMSPVPEWCPIKCED